MRFIIRKTEDYKLFMDAIINGNWDEATELYNTLPEAKLALAGVVIGKLVKQFKNDALRRVLDDYPSLGIDTLNGKGQTALIVAFGCANEIAALCLYEHGANALTFAKVQDKQNDILQYAKWSRDDKMIELAEKMLEQGNKPRPHRAAKSSTTATAAAGKTKQDPKDLAARFLSRRLTQESVTVIGDVRHYKPDFQ